MGAVRRHTSALLVMAGLAGGLGGGYLIGIWCLGLVLIVESALLVFVGFARDDQLRLPDMSKVHTVKDVLIREARSP